MTRVRFFGISLHTRAHRRWAVCAMYASYLAVGAAAVSGGRLVTAPFAIVCIVAFVAVIRWTRGYGIDSRSRTDEREAHVRDRALAWSYRITGFLLLLATGGWTWIPATEEAKHYVFWGALLLVSSLPQAFIAWNEPDALESNHELGFS